MNDLTEEQQVEQLKAWWQENGRAIVIGIVLGGAGLIGWYQWQGSQRQAAESASVVFEQAAEAADAGDLTILKQRVSVLRDEHAGSPYLSQAELRLAGIFMQRGEADEAEATLRALLARERGTWLEPVIGERLARVLIYRDQPAAALEVLDAIEPGTHAPLFAEARGDALLAEGRVDEAVQAYQAALDNPGQPQLIDVSLVTMKLAQLPKPEPTAETAP